MPILSDINLTGASWNSSALKLTISGTAFAETRGDVGKAQISLTGAGTWVDALSYDSWVDNGAVGGSQVVAVFSAPAAGEYDVRLINGDGEVSNVLTGAFMVTAGMSSGMIFFFNQVYKKHYA